MEDSILKSTKKILQIPEDYADFDVDVITHINTAFSILHDLGVGPVDGFEIEDDKAVWADFTGTEAGVLRTQLNKVKTYIYLRVRKAFDPPTTPYHVTAMDEQIKELEFRMNVNREEARWASQSLPSLP